MEKLYRELYPMRICLITSRHGGKDNVMTAAWVMPVSWDPVLFAVAIGEERFSCGLVRKGKAFGINLPHGALEDMALACGTQSGEDINKFEAAGITKEEGKHVPLVKDCPVSIECELVDELKAGDHYLLVGKPVKVVRRFKAKGLYRARGDEFAEL